MAGVITQIKIDYPAVDLPTLYMDCICFQHPCGRANRVNCDTKNGRYLDTYKCSCEHLLLSETPVPEVGRPCALYAECAKPLIEEFTSKW